MEFKIRKNLFFLFFMLVLLSAEVFAGSQAPKQLGKFGDWTAYSMIQDGKKVCYIISYPTDSKGNYTKRGEVYTLVTHRPSQNSKNVISLHAGYSFGAGASVMANIDKKSFNFFGEGETAWAPNANDAAIAKALSLGNRMIVKGVSARGTKTEDVYSLRGFGRALREIDKACGIK